MTPAIQTYELTKVYRARWRRREIRAVDGVSLRVERGTTFGLLGPNGAGKTTFVKLLLSVVHPTRGRAEIFGRDARIPEARRPVGYLPENHRFPGYLTGAAMLDFFGALSGMPARDRKRRIPELLERVGLAQWADVRLKKYSKGMLQRLGLAQALLHSPSLLILDEPSDGVDPVGRIQIREILRELENQGVTIFLNSHMLSEVELFCREVAILHRGRVALTGPVRELTAGRGYKLTAAAPPEGLIDELRAKAASCAASNGFVEFLFPDREVLNEAIDRLRAHRCPIESIVRTTSTLEQVFVRTLEGRGEDG
ncbi:MAG: ABC transporter ATP-binding protein [Bryobacterales bacterium]|nr:ABC transporter ATP-binding protein [Bryobacteraceae bacterium]MDW8354644.1 ABC transporter ATP-binding protein [Bryobacterales bacterium]